MHRRFDSLKLLTGPTVEPVTLADMKNYLRVVGTDEDSLITNQIAAARQKVEKILGRALITQSWIKVSSISLRRITIEYPPLQSITSIKTYDDADVATVNSSANYIVVSTSEPGLVLLKKGVSWLTHRNDASFEIIFVAGYGDAASDIPEEIIEGVKMYVTKIYNRRGDESAIREADREIREWLSAYRAFSV